MQSFSARPVVLPRGVEALRREVRALIATHVSSDPVCRANSWALADPRFSRTLGDAGLIGMTWPKEYGGHERDALERYVVLEELLAAGAPVGAHWIADRQTGPLLLRYGTEAQCRRWLPGMVAGTIFGCIGLSEPGAGSDLAAVRSTGRLTSDGWVVEGQKLWTTNAHHAHVMIALLRTQPGSERNTGLSQLLIPMDTPGVTVRPIVDLVGGHDFNEVFFDHVRLPADALVGTAGNGWAQVTAELSLERSGPERYLSSHALLVELARFAGASGDHGLVRLTGQLLAELWTLRLMSLSVAARLAEGEDPVLEAAMVKDLGNSFEQAIPRLIQASAEFELSSDEPLARTLAYVLQISPSFSLRGGTREVLKGIIARGLGLR